VPDAPARDIVVAPGIGSHPPASENAPPPAPSTRSARLPALRAAAVHMVFAARRSNEFITPAGVLAAEAWASRGVLDALVQFPIDAEVAPAFSNSLGWG
jgi:uridine phosphorylase